MPQNDWIDLLFRSTWWSYDTAEPSFHSAVYHAFNLVEGVVWLVCGTYVLARFRRHRKSALEPVYATAFLLFGLTDFREAWSLDSWLLWIKALNLASLLWLRAIVRRRHYPHARLL